LPSPRVVGITNEEIGLTGAKPRYLLRLSR
jgi:hypothetical protein